MISCGVPSRDDLAAMDAGGRAHVDDVVGRAGSPPRHARRRAPCCRGRAGASACRAGARCRAGAGRSTARRARRARRSGPSRSARRAGCAGSRRRTACRSCAPASGSRGRHRSGSAAARGSPSGCARRSRVCCGVSCPAASSNQRRAVADRQLATTSPMCLPAIFTASASRLQPRAAAGLAGRRRTGSAPAPRAPSRLSVSCQRRSRLGITPSKGLVRLVGAQRRRHR